MVAGMTPESASSRVFERTKELFAVLAPVLASNEVGYLFSFAHSITSWSLSSRA